MPLTEEIVGAEPLAVKKHREEPSLVDELDEGSVLIRPEGCLSLRDA